MHLPPARTRHARALAAALCAVSTAALADITEGVNRIRARGCDGLPGAASSLRTSAELDRVAQEWSKGGRLQRALERTGYHSRISASMQVAGSSETAVVLRALERSDCNVIADPRYTEIGVHRRGVETWVVVAAPLALPAPEDARAVAQRVLTLVNEARARERTCGRIARAAAAPLVLSPLLTRAALGHAQDMAKHERLQHRGSDGSGPADRVTQAGYSWHTVGENVAVGPADAESVVRGWLASPGHCANIMGAAFSEMGLAYVVDPASEGGIYWTQIFASPK